MSEEAGGFAVALDGKPVRTPGRNPLTVPKRSIAQALAAEWDAQVGTIDPATMPLSRLVNSAIDGSSGPGQHRHRYHQILPAATWFATAPIFPMGWSRCRRGCGTRCSIRALTAHGWRYRMLRGRHACSASLPASAGRRRDGAAADDAFQVAGLHSMTTLTGSVLLALAVAQGRLEAATAWTAAHAVEDWQVSRWGEDVEAKARRQARWREMIGCGESWSRLVSAQ